MVSKTSDTSPAANFKRRSQGLTGFLEWLVSTPRGFVALCMCLAVAFCLSRIEVSPTIGIDSFQMILGPFPAGTNAEMHIPFCNRGLLPLRVTNLKTGCACVRHSLSKDVLRRGETSEIVLHYDLKGKVPGVSREIVALETNDWNHPYITFPVAVRIAGGWRVLPKELLVIMPSGQGAKRTVQVLYDGEGSGRILSVRWDNAHLVSSLGSEKVFDSTQRSLHEIELSCDASFEGYECKGNVFIETNSRNDPILSLPVVIRKSGYQPAPSPDSRTGSG